VNVSQPDRAELLSSTFAAPTRTTVRRPAGREEGLALASRWLALELSRIDDLSFAHRFARACPLEGVPPEAYAPRWLPGRPGVLAGIRFKGGDVGFVELIAWDAPLADAGSWSDMLRRIRGAFSVFAPSFVRIRWPGELPPPGIDRPLLDQWLVAERLAVLRDRPTRDEPQGVTIAPVQDLVWFPEFATEHATWRAAAGELGDEVSPAERAELEACLESGAVVCLFEGRSWRGVVAARREDERAITGYCVVEEFLTGAARGKGVRQAAATGPDRRTGGCRRLSVVGHRACTQRAVVGGRTVRRSRHPGRLVARPDAGGPVIPGPC
jgi:hypothetical protein